MKIINIIALSLAGASLSAAAVGQPAPTFVNVPAQVQAGTYQLDPSHGKITWSMSHMGFSTYIGQFTDVSGTLTIDPARPERSTLNAAVKTASVGTFSDHLNGEMKSAAFLDSTGFPTATFIATQVALTGKNTADITGNLTLKGVTKPIVIAATFNQAGVNPADKLYSVGFDGVATIKRSDFGVNYGLPFLGDEVKLQIEAEFKQAAGK